MATMTGKVCGGIGVTGLVGAVTWVHQKSAYLEPDKQGPLATRCKEVADAIVRGMQNPSVLPEHVGRVAAMPSKKWTHASASSIRKPQGKSTTPGALLQATQQNSSSDPETPVFRLTAHNTRSSYACFTAAGRLSNVSDPAAREDILKMRHVRCSNIIKETEKFQSSHPELAGSSPEIILTGTTDSNTCNQFDAAVIAAAVEVAAGPTGLDPEHPFAKLRVFARHAMYVKPVGDLAHLDPSDKQKINAGLFVVCPHVILPKRLSYRCSTVITGTSNPDACSSTGLADLRMLEEGQWEHQKRRLEREYREAEPYMKKP